MFSHTRLCALCQTHKPFTAFQGGGTRCRDCRYQATYAQRRRDGRVKRPVETQITLCPVCFEEQHNSAALISHLSDQHRDPHGRILGIDTAFCQICGKSRKDLISHLGKAHSLSAAEYLERFPKALLQALGSSALGGGRMASGERRRLMVKLRAANPQCPYCDLAPTELEYHLRRWHGHDVDRALYDGHDTFLEILSLRPLRDVQWRWSNVPVVYFIQPGGPLKPIKIGFSQRLLHRLRSFQTDNPDHLTVLHVRPGSIELEHELHERFGHLQIRREWFQPRDDLVSFILESARQLAPDDNPLRRVLHLPENCDSDNF